jgi:hypothetical protein
MIDNPYTDLFPELKEIYTYNNCPHFELDLFMKNWFLNNTLAHASSKWKNICIFDESMLSIEDQPHNVMWHEYAHIIEVPHSSWHGDSWLQALKMLDKEYLFQTSVIPFGWIPRFRKDPVLYHKWMSGDETL